METCKTCKYFNTAYGWDGEDNGTCKRLGMSQLLAHDVWFKKFILFHLDNNPQSVHVGESFGCIFHENKQAGKD